MRNFIYIWIIFQHGFRIAYATPNPEPSEIPTQIPSGHPTRKPSRSPSFHPSRKPSAVPTTKPSSSPSGPPTRRPSDQPTSKPSAGPTDTITKSPSTIPTSKPSPLPTSSPSGNPTSVPSVSPSSTPSLYPTRTSWPSSSPTIRCANDLTFFNNYDREQTCQWIGESEDRDSYCVQEKVYLACPVTCGICCRDDETFTTMINNKERDCEFIGKSLERRLLYCGSITNGVRDHCAKTCQMCYKEAPFPSASPSVSPTVTCVNDPDFFWLEPLKTCDWIDKKSSRRIVYCQNKPVWQNCPLVCGVCCEDDLTFSFQINEYTYNCGWVEQTQTMITYCNDDSGVFEACPKICNNCRPDVVYPPTQPPVTSSPTFTSPPTTPPSGSPTIQPSSLPTSTPSTSSPTSSPTRFCADDSTYAYIEEDRTCAFIDEKGFRRKKWCAYDEVRVGCPRTCGVCNCRDNKDFRIIKKKDKKKKCQWVARKKKRKKKHCKEGKFSDVLFNCPESCDLCRKSRSYPTQSPTTSSPTFTERPSFIPTVNPTNIPSVVPTNLKEPSSFPTTLCLDDPDYYFDDPGRNCEFIGSYDFLREKYCPESEVEINCPKACGICCNDDPSFRYVIDSGESEACGYLTASPSETDLRISKYCTHYTGADKGCPKTCGTCPRPV